MNMKKFIIIGLGILLLFASILTIFVADNMNRTRSMREFKRIVEQGNLEDITLTIYYVGLVFAHWPVTVDYVIARHHYKAVVDGVRLAEHIDLLQELGSVDMRRIRSEGGLWAEVYYIFETNCGRKLLDVALWVDNYNVLVNGFEVRGNDIFTDVIIPFLSEEIAEFLMSSTERQQWAHKYAQ